uniref:Variant surface glycoprotein (VSG, atypical), putative n=1 Tax=Trypanosoma brucei brucei (strain 927/4 GUTat10.1) TaxID=185431 RepID=Q4FKM1_TRYB2|nr:variant surface glycoprotein (VSG, atypical), putative [Trypanosoma brucei brucei TREU927]
MRSTLLFTTIYIVLKVGISSAQKVAERTANEQVTDFCSVDIYYESIENEVKEWTATAIAEAASHEAEAKMLTLAAEVQRPTQKGAAYKVLATLAQDRANKAAAAAAAATKTLSDALTIISRTRAQISTFYGLAGQKATSERISHETVAGSNTLLTRGTPSRRCAATLTRTPPQSATCTDQQGKAAKLKSIAGALSTAKAVKSILKAKTKLAEVKVAFEGVGNLGTSSGWNVHSTATHCEDHASGQAAASANHAIAITGITEKYAISFDDVKLDQEPDGEAAKEPQTTNEQRSYFVSEQQLAEAIRQARQAQITITPLLQTESIEKVASSEAAAALYDFMTGQHSNRPEKKPEAEKVAKLIFGEVTGSINDDFIKPLSKDKLTIPTSGKPIEGSTQKLAQENFDTAMVYYFSLNTEKETANTAGDEAEGDEKADVADKSGEKKDGDKKEECKAAEEKDCDKTKWDWNAEKNECKVKEGVAVISPVITKAPILLAFLLLLNFYELFVEVFLLNFIKFMRLAKIAQF